ncbi:MAG TPA: histidine--tRNA ligase [Anaerolineales bacterium]|nr:histidine--tRNA ligase [Anaerolineales bacterium]
MKTIISPVKGTRDFYPEALALRQWLYGELARVSRAFGYQEYDGPFLEPMALYAAKSGEELVREQSFCFNDRGGDEITLRPELTPSLARMVAARQRQLPLPIRWWSFGPFWRYERPQKGRTREFFQWNIDLLGVESPEADAELAAVAATFLRNVGLKSSQVYLQVNNRRLLEAELTRLGIAPELRGMVFRLIDRRDKMRASEWEAYAADQGLNTTSIRGISQLLENKDLWTKSEELQAFFQAVKALGLEEYVEYDPTIVRGLDYYTGTVFEARDRDGEFRAVLGGGRYDNLVGDVGGDRLPGVGFAMGDVVIQLVLEKFGCLPSLRAAPAQVLVTTFGQGEVGASLDLGRRLREVGLLVEWYPTPDRLPKQLKYADQAGIRFAVICGPDESARGSVSLKDLAKREQIEVKVEVLAEEVRRRLLEATNA